MDTLLQRPAYAFCLYVMAHGAGAGMRHPFLQAVDDALETLGMATLRNGRTGFFILGIFFPIFWIFGALSRPTTQAV